MGSLKSGSASASASANGNATEINITLWETVKRPLTIEEMDNNFKSIEAIASIINNLKDELSQIETNYNAMVDNFKELDSRVSNNQDVVNLKSDMDVVKNQITSLSANISNIENAISKYKALDKYIDVSGAEPALKTDVLANEILSKIDVNKLCDLIKGCNASNSGSATGSANGSASGSAGANASKSGSASGSATGSASSNASGSGNATSN